MDGVNASTIDRLRRARWLFFDVGCTLVDEDAAARDRFGQIAQVLQAHGVHRSFEQICGAYVQVCRDFAPLQFQGMLDRLELNKQQQQIVWKQTTYRHDLETLYPGVDASIRRLSARYKLGIIANQNLGTAQRLANHGIGEFFSACCASAELKLSKPDPRIFQRALTEAERSPTDAVMIGDRLDNDIRPAKALGMMTVRVLTGPTAAQQPRNADETPDLTVTSISEFTDRILGDVQHA